MGNEYRLCLGFKCRKWVRRGHHIVEFAEALDLCDSISGRPFRLLTSMHGKVQCEPFVSVLVASGFKASLLCTERLRQLTLRCQTRHFT